mmetsp:Transcript_107637/g.304478  ORF Transcript_107637/g.304478 Transcript_107637/m.304478 type:complete len:245 (-) Transcript_107637:222-956(-)
MRPSMAAQSSEVPRRARPSAKAAAARALARSSGSSASRRRWSTSRSSWWLSAQRNQAVLPRDILSRSMARQTCATSAALYLALAAPWLPRTRARWRASCSCRMSVATVRKTVSWRQPSSPYARQTAEIWAPGSSISRAWSTSRPRCCSVGTLTARNLAIPSMSAMHSSGPKSAASSKTRSSISLNSWAVILLSGWEADPARLNVERSRTRCGGSSQCTAPSMRTRSTVRSKTARQPPLCAWIRE